MVPSYPPGFTRPLDKSPPGLRRFPYAGMHSTRSAVPHFQNHQQNATAAGNVGATGPVQPRLLPFGVTLPSHANHPAVQWNTYANVTPYVPRPPHPYGAIGDHLDPKPSVGMTKNTVKPRAGFYDPTQTLGNVQSHRQAQSYPHLEAYQQRQTQPQGHSYHQGWLSSEFQWPQTRLQSQTQLQSQSQLQSQYQLQSQARLQSQTQLQSQPQLQSQTQLRSQARFPSQLQSSVQAQAQAQIQLQNQLRSNGQSQPYPHLPSLIQAQMNSQLQAYQQFQPGQQPQSGQQFEVHQQLQFRPQTQMDFQRQQSLVAQSQFEAMRHHQAHVQRDHSYTLVDDSGASSPADSPMASHVGHRVSPEIPVQFSTPVHRPAVTDGTNATQPFSSRLVGVSMNDSSQLLRLSTPGQHQPLPPTEVVTQTPASFAPTSEVPRTTIRAPPGLPMPLPSYPSRLNPYSVLSPPTPARPLSRPAGTEIPLLVPPFYGSSSDWIKRQNELNASMEEKPRSPLPFEGLNVPISLYPGHFVAQHKYIVDALALVCAEMHRQNNGNGITTSQYDDTYQVAFYAHNNTQFFYSTGNRGNGSWDIYGYPNSIQDNATNTDTYGPDFLNTNSGVDVELSDYDVNYSDLAVTYDPLGPSGLWFFYLDSNGLNIFSNVGRSTTDVTADPGDTELPTNTFTQRYSGWSSVNRTIGITAYTDVLRNYSRAYWMDSKDNVVYIERDGSDTTNAWTPDTTTVEFTGSGKTSTGSSGSGSDSSSTSNGLSTGAKIGIGAGVGCGSLLAIIAIAIFLIRRQKAAKAAKIAKASEVNLNSLADPSVCSPSVSPGIMKTPHELMGKESPVPTASPNSLGGAWSPAPAELSERRETETHEMMGDVPTASELPAVEK